MPVDLSVVLPAYNEHESIVEAVTRSLDVLPELVREFEVIVVDDGSSDGTADAVAPLLDEHYPHVRVLRHPQNRGYGAAIRTGLEAAQGRMVFYTDADNQFDIGELAGFIPLLDDADVVIGFRIQRFDPFVRVVLSRGYNLLVRFVFRVRVHDVDCSFKLFRREVVDAIEIDTDDFFVDTELVAKARNRGFRVVEKGVTHYPRQAGETTVRVHHIPRTLVTVARMWRGIHGSGSSKTRAAWPPAEELTPGA